MMGLTLNYQIYPKTDGSDAEISTLIEAMHAMAKSKRAAGLVDGVTEISSAPEALLWQSEWLQVPVSGEENTYRGIEIPAVQGSVFAVTLGHDCEPLRLGLCRYPSEVVDTHTGKTCQVRSQGWRFSGACKTQYTSLHGWESFRRAHTMGVDLLNALCALGLDVKIKDEGGYWPGRDLAELRRRVDRMNGMVAALSGAMKDASEEGDGPKIQARIFSHPQFEHLEAEGMERDKEAIQQALKQVNPPEPPADNVT